MTDQELLSALKRVREERLLGTSVSSVSHEGAAASYITVSLEVLDAKIMELDMRVGNRPRRSASRVRFGKR